MAAESSHMGVYSIPSGCVGPIYPVSCVHPPLSSPPTPTLCSPAAISLTHYLSPKKIFFLCLCPPAFLAPDLLPESG